MMFGVEPPECSTWLEITLKEESRTSTKSRWPVPILSGPPGTVEYLNIPERVT